MEGGCPQVKLIVQGPSVLSGGTQFRQFISSLEICWLAGLLVLIQPHLEQMKRLSRRFIKLEQLPRRGMKTRKTSFLDISVL